MNKAMTNEIMQQVKPKSKFEIADKIYREMSRNPEAFSSGNALGMGTGGNAPSRMLGDWLNTKESFSRDFVDTMRAELARNITTQAGGARSMTEKEYPIVMALEKNPYYFNRMTPNQFVDFSKKYFDYDPRPVYNTPNGATQDLGDWR